ncbi:hypothetical protein GGX14DRAFT_607193 [Mycena pura]|uniref:Uncharacterized protein n=1 Tax=Mycena pura TaxID=153505 RepID=A0AAD6YF04_9AGAR|nr:hypothetical protein GGX14DRAFT_607193 [Mycena pura]
MQDSKPDVELLQPSPSMKQKKEELEPPPAGDSFETVVRALDEARNAILAARGQPPTVAQATTVPMIPVAEAEQQAAALRAEIARLQAEIDKLRGAAAEADKARGAAVERERTDIAQRLRGLAQLVEGKGNGASSAPVPLRRAAPESAGESTAAKRPRAGVDPLFD